MFLNCGKLQYLNVGCLPNAPSAFSGSKISSLCDPLLKDFPLQQLQASAHSLVNGLEMISFHFCLVKSNPCYLWVRKKETKDREITHHSLSHQ